jgi:hypothetical protein
MRIWKIVLVVLALTGACARNQESNPAVATNLSGVSGACSEGQSIPNPDACNTCACENGAIVCTQSYCGH